MFFEKDFKIALEKVYQVHVEGYMDFSEVTGYVYPKITEVILVDEDDNLITEDSPEYAELMVIVHERDYEPAHWSE